MTDLLALAAVPVLLAAACALALGTLGRHHGHHQAAAQSHFPGPGRRDPFPAQADDPTWPQQLHHAPCWEPVPPATGPLPAAMATEPPATAYPDWPTGAFAAVISEGGTDASAQE